MNPPLPYLTGESAGYRLSIVPLCFVSPACLDDGRVPYESTLEDEIQAASKDPFLAIQSVCFSPDTKHLAASAGNELRVRDSLRAVVSALKYS